jgi:transposase
MLRMLERHAVQELLRAGVSPRAIAKQYGVSRRTLVPIRQEPSVTAAAVADTVGRPAATGRPRVDGTLRTRVVEWLREERDFPPARCGAGCERRGRR